MSKNKHADIEKMSFEDALKELENLVRKLESGGQTLDDSIENYSRGVALKEHCEKKLKEAKLKVEKIVQNPDGSLSLDDA